MRETAPSAFRLFVRGTVQGVGFRPFVYQLACTHRLHGWVRNDPDGVCIHVEGDAADLERFVSGLPSQAPPAARVAAIDATPAAVTGHAAFEILDSRAAGAPTTRIAPDLPVCEACLHEMADASDRRYHYPYINCTNCGPRYSIVWSLPYDRARTTMNEWPLCDACAAEYADPGDRRFHAQPVACPACGPAYVLMSASGSASVGTGSVRGDEAVARAAARLREGAVLAIKGIGGYHLACDASRPEPVRALRERKYRKEKAFAVMVRDLAVADATIVLAPAARVLLESAARPIVLARARLRLEGVAPDNDDLGVMLPYTPLHHMLFAHGAPPRLVMTSGNRSDEPIAYDDEDARRRLGGLADAWLVGERAIARRVDDSIVRAGPRGPLVLRRSRGLAPAPVGSFPDAPPLLAVGGDLKNTVTLVVGGQAYVSQHIGDLTHAEAFAAFHETIRDLLTMYGVLPRDVTVVHDAHPQYVSTSYATTLDARQVIGVQHHRAHIASVAAERGAFDRRVLGVAFDGTGYGDDGTIWGGEWFVGSVRDGFERVAHLAEARLPGGDAAARHPVQAAAGYLADLEDLPDLTGAPFHFPDRYRQARVVASSGLRTFRTTSAGRLFDTAAALVGFTRPITFEGQAAMWLEHLARQAPAGGPIFPCPLVGESLDWRDVLRGISRARGAGTPPAVLARAFHRSLAAGMAGAIRELAARAQVDTVVLSGGVLQNMMLVEDLLRALSGDRLQVWTNHEVPPNDGGLSLGQAALVLGAVAT